jgi:hypothetical protein
MSGGFLRFAGRMGNMASICEKIDKGVAGNKLDQPINPQKKSELYPLRRKELASGVR